MKKILFAMLLVLASVNANAQFEKGTQYGNTYLSGLGIGYGGTEKFYFGIGGDYGYFIENNWMLRGGAGYQHVDGYNAFTLNLGGRYYFKKCGVFTGLGLQYEHKGSEFNWFQFVPEVGYCFYVNHYISLEPSVYADLCCNDWSNGSRVGLKFGVAVYW